MGGDFFVQAQYELSGPENWDFTSYWQKGDDWQKQASSYPRTLCFLTTLPSFEDFSVLATESNDFKLKIMWSLLIEHDKAKLNKTDMLIPLELF